jgi:hypothetical protein
MTGGLPPNSSSWQPSPLRITNSNYIFQLNTRSYCPYVTSSLMRGLICCLQLLLVLANAAILRSEFLGAHDQILLSRIRDSPNLEGQVPPFISFRKRVPGFAPKPCVPFPSPLTVKLFDPASTWD